MNHIKVAGVIITVIAIVLLRGGVFVSMPKLSRPSDDVLVVGEPSGDYARYSVGQSRSFAAASIGYDFRSGALGGDLITKLGGRGLVSYLDPASYRDVMQTCSRTGECLGNVLGAYESSGRLGHLILIPQDQSAIDQMRKATIKDGNTFRLSGRSLSLVEMRSDGQSVSVQLGTTGCFLVESIVKE